MIALTRINETRTHEIICGKWEQSRKIICLQWQDSLQCIYKGTTK